MMANPRESFRETRRKLAERECENVEEEKVGGFPTPRRGAT